MDYLIGGVSGAVAAFFTNPMDVVKTRMQLQGELCPRAQTRTKYKHSLHALYVIVRADGLLAVQQGLVPAMCMGFILNAIRLGLFHVFDDRGYTKNKKGDLVFYKSAVCSGLCGFLSGIVVNPVSLVKTRMQSASSPSIAVGKQYQYKGMIDGLKTIYRYDGVMGFFAGVRATTTRIAAGSMAQLTTFTKSKEALKEYAMFADSPVLLAFASSCISGMVLAIFVVPLDVVNIRLFNQGSKLSGEQLYNGFIGCFRKIVKVEGFYGLYKGLGAFYFRMAPYTTLSLCIWDALNNVYIKYNKNER